MTPRLLLTGCVIACLACGVASPSALAASYRSVRIDGIPHVEQKPDFCGEACAEMYLRKLGKAIDQNAVFNASGLDPLLGRGCYTRDLAKALRQLGFDTGPVWNAVKPDRSEQDLEALFSELHRDLLRGVPSIVCTRYDERPRTTEHFRLIVGYDSETDEILYHEPAEKEGAYRRMSRATLFSLWPLKYEAERWTVIRFALHARRIAEAATTTGFSSADYAQHMMELKRKLPGEQFHVVLQPPFLVVGDEDPETVKVRSESTIQWAVERLKRDYFARDPEQIVDIWLFKDKESYEKHTLQLFGRKPTTPFGYYSASDRALVMNISTGGGTLVHEIVHPFVASNFPECPSWFNEGLASLYEQCGDKEGRIYGYTNWRLRGLQQALKAGPIPTFESLCATTTHEFYREDPGTNYAQARYLCYYLQERDLLVKYFHAFRKGANDDPTGYKTLQQVLDVDDMTAFQDEWQAFVLKLK